jgi:predicted metal-dependent hydrolase
MHEFPAEDAPADSSRAHEMPRVVVRRSTRRKRTISARREGETTILMVPAHLTQAQIDEAASELVAKLDARETATRGPLRDEALLARAHELSQRYLDGRAVPISVRWVTNQNARWGSCSVYSREIRLSHRMQYMPEYVIDAVLVHELAHLIEANHGPAFKELEARYPHQAKATGFLEGATWRR